MKYGGRNNRYGARDSVRSFLLTVFAVSCLLGYTAAGWALTSGATDSRIFLPPLPLSNTTGFGLPTLSGLSGQQQATTQETAVLGKVQLSFGKTHKISLDAFSYGGKSAVRPFLNFSAARSLTGTPGGADPWTLPQLVPTSALAAAKSLDDQVQSFKVGLDSGPAKFSVGLRTVGANFANAASGLQGVAKNEVEALVKAAGTRAFDLEGSLQLSKNASFSSVRKSLYNDKPGDGNHGLTSTDWTNALALNLGANTNLRLALTEHAENWDPSANKTDTRRRTTELGGETKFGAGGKYGLRFGLTQVQNQRDGKDTSSEQTQEFHLALPLHARLRLSADYTSKQDGAGHGLTTNALSSVLQLYPGAELTAHWKALSPTQGEQTQETFLKFTGDLGHGGSSAHLAAEQTETRTPDQGMLRTLKFGLTGGLGQGSGRLNLRAAFQDRTGDHDTAPLERLTTLHLDRAFGPRLSVAVDHEEKLNGTVANFTTNTKSVAAVTAALSRQTKLTAGFTSQDNRTGNTTCTVRTTWTRDLTLEHRLGALSLRAEDHRRAENDGEKTETLLGLEWNRGGLPDWAANLSRRHEFDDIYDYQVAREAGWLDIPFRGTRLWIKRRTGGEDDGIRSFLVSHRTILATRYHLQFTYHDRPEFEDGSRKGRPQPLRRQYLELGTPLTRGLVARTWLTREQRADDPQALRHTLGLGLTGKLKTNAQTELYYTQDTGRWEARQVDRKVLALLYHRLLDEDHKLTLKLGYAWGDSVANGAHPDYRLTLAYANPA